MITQKIKHNIYGKSTDKRYPTVEVNSNATIWGSVSVTEQITSLDASLYKMLPATGMNSPDYLIIGDDISSSDNLSYTGIGSNNFTWRLDPKYIAHDGVTGISHGDYYGIEFLANTDDKRYVPDVVISVNTTFGDYGITGLQSSNIYVGPQGETGAVDLSTIKRGSTQVDAGAEAGELWYTIGHVSLPDGVMMYGI